MAAGLLLVSLMGCFGGGGGDNTLPPQVSIRGLKDLQYNSVIPFTLWIEGQEPMHVSLAIVFRIGTTGQYSAASAMPGTSDPTSLSKLLIPSGGTSVGFSWHAAADIDTGLKYGSVWIKAIVTTDDGVISEAVFGPFTVDFTDSLSGSLPPYVPSLTLPGSYCGADYEMQLPVEGGHAPFEWSLFPVGSQLPPFLELSYDGKVYGTIPEDFGPATITFVAKVRDSNPILPRESAGAFSIFVDCAAGPGCAPPPDILFDSIPEATEGEAYVFQCNATGGEGELLWSLADGTLPANLELSPAGMISGTVIDGSAGMYELVIQCCDSCPIGHQCDQVPITFVVNEPSVECDPPPTITTTSLPDGQEGVEYSYQLLAAGGHGSLEWTLDDGELPTGMFLTQTGLLTGTPAAGTGGDVYVVIIGVCDECPLGEQCDQKEFALTIDEPPGPCPEGPFIDTTSPIDNAVVGESYNFVFEASGGQPPLLWVLNNPGELPASLQFNGDGSITGTPDEGTVGVYSLDVTVQDSCVHGAQSANGIFELNVTEGCAPAPTITTLSIPAGFEETEYSFQFSADNGEGVLTWSVIAGTLPDGLDFADTGLLSGTPAAGTAGTYSDIEIQVEDSCPEGAQSSSNLYNLSIYEPCAEPPSITTIFIDAATEGVLYDFTLEATGGDGALSWEILDDGDQLPTGLIMVPSGVISGTPAVGTIGDYNIVFQVCDQCPVTQCDSRELTLSVTEPCDPGPTITTETLPVAMVGTPYNYQLEATGGDGDLSWILSDPFTKPLPFPFQLTPDGIISGTASGEVGDHIVEITVRDSCASGAQTDTKDLLFTIDVDGCLPPPEIFTPDTIDMPSGFVVDLWFLAEYGHGDLTWEITNAVPPLPLTLKFDPIGRLLGTTEIADAGSYVISIEVCDSCDDPGPQCDSQDVTLNLLEATGCGAGPPSIDDVTIPTPVLDTPYNHAMTATGGDIITNLHWFAVGLPLGLDINPDTGEIQGTVPSAEAGTYNVYIGVSDDCLPVPQADSALYVWDIS